MVKSKTRKNSSGFASGSFHQAQLQSVLWNFDCQNLPGFASGSFHQAQYRGLLGHSEIMRMFWYAKIIPLSFWRFSLIPRHSYAILKVFWLSKIIRFCLQWFTSSSAVWTLHFRTFWDRFYGWKSSCFASGSFHQVHLQSNFWKYFDGLNLPGFASSGFHQGQLQCILASQREFWEHFDRQILPGFASGGFHRAQL